MSGEFGSAHTWLVHPIWGRGDCVCGARKGPGVRPELEDGLRRLIARDSRTVLETHTLVNGRIQFVHIPTSRLSGACVRTRDTDGKV